MSTGTKFVVYLLTAWAGACLAVAVIVGLILRAVS